MPLTGTLRADTLVGGSGDDTLLGLDHNDRLEGGAGADRLEGGAGQDTIFGGAGNDVLIDHDGAVFVFGEDGADLIEITAGSSNSVSGGAGDDTITGYAQEADLYGGAGRDLYRLEGHWNVIRDFQAGADGDVLDVSWSLGDRLGENPFKTGQIKLFDYDGSVYVQIGTYSGGGVYPTYILKGLSKAQLTAANFGGYDPGGAAPQGVTLEGDRGGSSVLSGGAGDDTLAGWSGDDRLMGRDGGDLLDGRDGNDFLEGGGGADTLSGGGGDDTLSGNDTLDRLLGGAGNDLALGGDFAVGAVDLGDGDDSLGAGSFLTVTGGRGADVFGVGAREITDFSPEEGDSLDFAALIPRLYDFAGGNPFATGHLRLVQSGADVLVQLDFSGTTYGAGFSDLVLLKGVQISEITAASLGGFDAGGAAVARLDLTGGSGGDRLVGGTGADVLRGADGGDTIGGGAGADRLEGGQGDDLLTDHLGTNTLLGGGGADNIALGGVGGVADGGDGADTISISGLDAVVTGGTGSDQFESLAAEIMNWNDPIGRNKVVITDFQAGASGDVIRLTPLLPAHWRASANPFTQGQVRVVQNGADAEVRWAPDGDADFGAANTIFVLRNVDAAALHSSNFGGYAVHGGTAGADTVSGYQFYGQPIRGEEGDDSLTGTSAFDDLHGNQGADTLAADAGDDWVVGGKDNDRLMGQGGSDLVYGNVGDDLCDGGDGADIVRGGQGNDILQGGAGADWMSGDRGDDTVSGGLGADIFHSFAGAGVDRVMDFNYGDGDRVLLDAGTNYVASQVGSNVEIDLGGGDRVILVSVDLSTLGTGWITVG